MTSGTSAPVAIVTGASRGIGAATAAALAETGYRLLLCSRSLADCRSVAEKIRSDGRVAESVECNVQDYGLVQDMVDSTLKQWGRIDVLVNNAGVMDPIAGLVDCEPQQWSGNIQTNLIGVFNGCRAVLPIFVRQGEGVVINLSSGAASLPLYGWSAYCVAKAGAAMLTQCASEEMAGTDVRVYGFQPGMVNTALTREALKSRINRVSELDPEQFDDTTRSAAAIVWLCSADARELAGRELTIDEVERHIEAGRRVHGLNTDTGSV